MMPTPTDPMNHAFSRFARLILCALALPLMAPAQAASDRTTAIIDFNSCARPAYPAEALRKDQLGTVKLEFGVTAEGKVSLARVASTSFHPLLDKAALDALRLCRFKPALENGKPAASMTTVTYIWTLDDLAAPEGLAKAPAHLRQFLAQARAADAMLDPYQRCLAFPDLPANSWPAGMGKQYCEITAGDRIQANVISRQLVINDPAGLDALFQHDLERHFSADHFSEVIHTDFVPFEHAGNDANLLSQEWLEKAPESPFANLARGMYLLASARAARGVEWASDTPRENMDRMSDFAVMAARHIDKALRLEPRLARRPLLSLVVVLPAIDQARVAASADDHARVVALLEPASKIGPHIDLLNQLARHMPLVDADEWETLVRLLTVYRYDNDDAVAAQMRGRLLSELAGDPAWALPSLRHAFALRPYDPKAAFDLGMAHQRLSNFSEAETLMTQAMATPQWHLAALSELIRLAGSQGQWHKAAQLGVELTEKYPDVAHGWFLYGYARLQEGAEADARTMLTKFVRMAEQQKVDPNDEELRHTRRYLAGERDRYFLGPNKD